MHWKMLQKILTDSVWPGYQRSAPIVKPKIGPFLGKIQEILAADKQRVRKQRHTAKKIWKELQKAGFTGQYTIVKDAVPALKKPSKEVFMPLLHLPGEAPMDFGQALVRRAGVLRKVSFLAMALPHSDAMFGWRHGCRRRRPTRGGGWGQRRGGRAWSHARQVAGQHGKQ